MNELVKVGTNENGAQVVSARDLHSFLVVEANGGQTGEMFAHWIKRMLEFGFKQGLDYVVEEYDLYGNPIAKSSNPDNQQVRVQKREYILTLDTAKHIAMVQKNDKGEEARNYFIACEKKANSLSIPNFTDPVEAARAWANEYEAKQLAEIKAKNLEQVLDRLSDYASITRVSQMLKIHEKNFSWRKLKHYSKVLGLEIKQVPSPRYKYQNTYHIDTFKAAYPQFDYSTIKDNYQEYGNIH